MKNKERNELKGYFYDISEEDIKKYISLPVEMRLEWLEDANRFLFYALDEKAKKIRELLKKGEI